MWSGTELFGNRATFDFKVATINDEQYLSFIVNEDINRRIGAGAGIILDSSYSKMKTTRESTGRGTMNMHEFTTVDNGASALMVTFQSQLVDLSEGTEDLEDEKWVGNNGFVELNMTTGLPIFEWWPLDHINLNETLMPKPNGPGSVSNIWDFL